MIDMPDGGSWTPPFAAKHGDLVVLLGPSRGAPAGWFVRW
jgi:hypothetical protein